VCRYLKLLATILRYLEGRTHGKQDTSLESRDVTLGMEVLGGAPSNVSLPLQFSSSTLEPIDRVSTNDSIYLSSYTSIGLYNKAMGADLQSIHHERRSCKCFVSYWDPQARSWLPCSTIDLQHINSAHCRTDHCSRQR